MFIVGAVAAIPLLLPACWLEAIHVYSAVDRFRSWLWLFVLISAVGLLFDAGKALFLWQKIKYRLHHLARDEQNVLAVFVLNLTSAQVFGAYQPAASSLADAGILYVTTETGRITLDTGHIYYTIKPWILRYLSKKRQLLGDALITAGT